MEKVRILVHTDRREQRQRVKERVRIQQADRDQCTLF